MGQPVPQPPTDPAPQPTDPAPNDPTPADPKPDDGQLGDAGKKAITAERQRAKAAERERDALVAKLKEIEDAGKSDAEKTAERLAAAEKKAAESELRALRAEVAAEKGLTPAQAKRLVGSTRDELVADADELLSTFGGQGQGQRSGAPKPDPSQGSKGTPTPVRPSSLGAAVAAGMRSK
jgi:hypothetical protein